MLGREPPRVCLDVGGRGCLDVPHTPQAPITRRVALSVYWSLGGVRSPKAEHTLQEVCVHEVGSRGGFVWARRWKHFFGGCRDCAWTGTAPGVLGRGRPKVLGRPSHPPSSYHTKDGLIGIYIEVYIYTRTQVYTYACMYIGTHVALP